MAAQVNVPTWRVSNYQPVRNNSSSTAISPNLLLVSDSTNANAAKVPATSATVVDFMGVAQESIAAASQGSVARNNGDIVVVKAGTSGVAVGNRIIIDVASGKEGRGTAYSTGTKTMVGVARTAADDGDLFEMLIQVMQIAV